MKPRTVFNLAFLISALILFAAIIGLQKRAMREVKLPAIVITR